MREATEREGARRAAAVVAAVGSALVLAACASSPEPEPDLRTGPAVEAGADSTIASEEAAEVRETADLDRLEEELDENVCVREATVTVRVWNEGSAAVRLRFGPYAPARITEAFSRTTYNVPRPYLDRAVRIEVARGGLQVGGPAYIQTEVVVCNIATLVIGGNPRYSVFYGDVIYEPSDLREAQEEEEEAAAADEEEADGAAADGAEEEADGEG